MKTIWKYPLQLIESQIIEVPVGHSFLTVQVQNDIPCLWILVIPDQPKIKVCISIYGTGERVHFAEGRQYIGTFQQHYGSLVWHVFASF